MGDTAKKASRAPSTRRRLVPTATVSVIVLAIFVLLFVATGILLVLNMFGVFS